MDRFIALDLSLYAGFSGGPLVDSGGRVLGMNTSALSRRFDLTIPNATVERVIDQLSSGRPRGRAYLGVGMQPVGLSESLRASAGEKGGVFLGDIIIGFNGTQIGDTDDILAQLGSDRIGSQVRLRVVRGGKVVEPSIVVGERSAQDEE